MKFSYNNVQTTYVFITYVTPIMILLLCTCMGFNDDKVAQGLKFGSAVAGIYSLLALPIGYMRTAKYTFNEKSVTVYRVLGRTSTIEYSSYKGFKIVSVSRGWLIAFKGALSTSVECYVHDNDMRQAYDFLRDKLPEIK